MVNQLCELLNMNDCCEIRWELMLWLKGCGVRSMNAFDRLQQQFIIQTKRKLLLFTDENVHTIFMECFGLAYFFLNKM